jgi:hypothetical protein
LKNSKATLGGEFIKLKIIRKTTSLRWQAMEPDPIPTASLTIIVDKDIVRLNEALVSFSGGWEAVSIGREISTILIGQNEAEYLSAINQWIDERIRNSPSDYFLCYDIDLFFHPSLKLDAIAIFRQISRHKKLVVLWPGSFQGGNLCYAQPEHNHYQCWKNLEGITIKGADNALQ